MTFVANFLFAILKISKRSFYTYQIINYSKEKKVF